LVCVFSFCPLFFQVSFFPEQNQTVQLLNTAGIFCDWFFDAPDRRLDNGTYADRKGRKTALTLSVLLMSVGSLIIAITPGYKTIGIAAPILLVVARIIQGLSVGGEYGTSATYLSEMATKKHRGFYVSFQYVYVDNGPGFGIRRIGFIAARFFKPRRNCTNGAGVSRLR